YAFVHSNPTSLSSVKTMLWVWDIVDWIGLFLLAGFLFWFVSTLFRFRSVIGLGEGHGERRRPIRGPRREEEELDEPTPRRKRNQEEEPDEAAPRGRRSREEEPDEVAPRRKRRRRARDFE